MLSPAKAARVDELMEKAQAALQAGQWFEAERVAQRALEVSHQASDFGRMRRILMPLLEARRQRMQAAANKAKVTWVRGELTEDHLVAAGLHMLEPPHVGADARRIRLTALRREVPALILCREPTTQLGLVPIVAIGLITVRARIGPPEHADKPSKQWFLRALELLGDAAVGMIDGGLDAVRQVDHAMSLIDSVPDHEGLHMTLIRLCEEAERETRDASTARDAKAAARVTERASD
ncbi:MAG: hypothetical protein EBR10_09410 [Planctomycetes bacterium]|nr:hypothetical protein [Planctomycetota bacterium]